MLNSWSFIGSRSRDGDVTMVVLFGERWIEFRFLCAIVLGLYSCFECEIQYVLVWELCVNAIVLSLCLERKGS